MLYLIIIRLFTLMPRKLYQRWIIVCVFVYKQKKNGNKPKKGNNFP